MAHFNAGRFAEALREFQAVPPNAKPAWMGLFVGQCLAALGRVREADAALAEARRDPAAGASSWAASGDLHTRRGKLAAASAAYKRALRLSPGDAVLAAKLARCRAAARAGAPDALTPAAPFPAALAGRLELPLRLAEVRLQEGDEAGARALWRTALVELDGAVDLPDLLERFRLLILLRRYSEAFAVGSRALGRRPPPQALRTFRWPWPQTRDALMSPERVFAPDLAELRRLSAAGRHGAWPEFYAGLLLRRMRRGGEAELRRAASRCRWTWMAAEIARELMQAGDPAAVGRLRAPQGAGGDPAAFRLHAYRGEALLAAGRSPEAFAEFSRARRRAGPELGDALAWEGEARLWLGQYRRALTLLDEAAAFQAQYAFCWRGAARLLLGDPETALRDVDLGLAAYPRDLEAYAWRGEILRALGRHAEAVEAVQVEVLRRSFEGALSLPESDGAAGDWRWAWHLVNRGLARQALGDAAGMRADAALLPLTMRAAVARRLRRTFGADWPAGETRELLLAALRLARGCRRPEPWVNRLWMGKDR